MSHKPGFNLCPNYTARLQDSLSLPPPNPASHLRRQYSGAIGRLAAHRRVSRQSERFILPDSSSRHVLPPSANSAEPSGRAGMQGSVWRRERGRLEMQQALAMQPKTPQVESKEPYVRPSHCSSLQELKDTEYSTQDWSAPEANSRKSMPQCCGCLLGY